jgi:hypothetical protein
MGDLSNSVAEALNYPADTPLNITCKWSGNKDDVKLAAYMQHEISAIFNEVCVIEAIQRPLIEVSFDIMYVIRISPWDDQLAFIITSASLQNQPEYKPLDPRWLVTDHNIARFSIARVVYGLAGRATFGTGYKTSKRYFPAVDVNSDYIIVFDPSQV